MTASLDPAGLPRFSDVDPARVVERVQAALAEHKRAVDAAKAEATTLEGFLVAKAAADFELGLVWSPVGHLAAVRNTPELRAAVAEAEPLLVAHDLAEAQDAELYATLKALHGRADLPSLPPATRRAAEHLMRDFGLRGADLSEPERGRFAQAVVEMSTLSTEFANAVLDATDSWTEHVTDEAVLSGVTEDAKARMAQAAQARRLEGWLVDLKAPSVEAVLTKADDRGLRYRLYAAFSTRASEIGPDAGRFDNGPRIERIMALRFEAARLLGFDSPAEWLMATKMVRAPGEALAFLTDLAARARPAAQRELDAMRAFARDELGIDDLQPWDTGYVAEKLRQARHDLDEEEVRAFFPVEPVLAGVFTLFERLFGVSVRPLEGADAWHEDVRVFELAGRDGEAIGGLYLDLFARAGKRGGAWMDVCRPRFRAGEGLHLPIAFVTCNFAPPAAGAPSLLRHDDVLTLLHEFGHALHHLLTEVDLPSVGGIAGVEWDAVELPSQLMENFAWDDRALAFLSRHWRTGEPLGGELFARMSAARRFNAASRLLRQVEFGTFDLRLHAEYAPERGARADEVLREVASEVAVMPPWPDRRTAHSFGHVFAGGYAAGYYSYLWAELLSLDAFERFEEEGVLSSEAGSAFQRAFLSQGASRPAMESFTAFRGREPRSDALLRRYGLAA